MINLQPRDSIVTETTKARPPLFRALGSDEPPQTVTIAGTEYELAELYKHDSWAATARYRPKSTCGASGNARTEDVVCKFNRVQPIFGIPVSWLGKLLASREANAYRVFDSVAGVCEDPGPVEAGGKIHRNAVGHYFVEGHPLSLNEKVSATFFIELRQMLREIHEAGFAFVDLHKRENILVGEDGKPYLTDFQISFQTRNGLLWKWPPGNWLLKIFQQSDLFCLSKHVRKHQPEKINELDLQGFEHPPWWIRAHRLIAVPFRQTRRRLLSAIGVRDKSGRSASEEFAEHAFRCDQEHSHRAA